MGSDGRARMRGVALIIVLALVGPLAALTAIAPAQADHGADHKVWAGPGCVEAEYTCQEDGTIVQVSESGNNLEAVCTLEECVISQTNTSGSNTLRCDQERTSNGDLACDIEQVNESGPNVALVDQDTTIANTNVLLESVEQEAGQTVTADQANQSGTNSLDVEQDVEETATTLVDVAATQTQEAHQVVDVSEMTSTSGDQDISVVQTEVLTADLGGTEATQHQNTSEEIGQTLVIGHDDTIGMDTDTGTNSIFYDQQQHFTQDASGPGGLATLLASEQVQGAENEEFPAAFANWKVDSNIADGTDVQGQQFKSWNQDTTPDQPSLGKVQDMWDELAIIGQLFSADTSSTTQKALLTQDGSRQRCDQRANLHADKLAEHEQNCNDEDTQSGSGENLNMHLRRCEGFESTEECEEATVNESTPAEETDEGGSDGCSQGEWKTSVDSWPDEVQPGDRFGDHFEGADVRFATLADLTMVEAINLPGGGPSLEDAAGNLARKAVAGLLNAESDLVAYELHSTELREQVNDALATGTRDEILDLKNVLEGFNNGECPL